MPRKDRFGFDVTLPATIARAADFAAEILGDPDPADLAFLHSVLAQCHLPYREPPAGARDYKRTNGFVSMVLSAGHLLDPQTNDMMLQGLPYGAKPRLLLTHLCTEAVRGQSPVVEVGTSMTAFMRELGFTATGGKHGTIGRFKEQLNRLAASRIQLGMRLGDRATMVNTPIVDQFDVWFPADPRQRTLWPSTVRLSNRFFETLRGHALPLDPRALRGIQHNARALDLYVWLAHRLPRVRSRSGDRVSWPALQGQFGGEVTRPRKFRAEFRTALRLALAVYPAAQAGVGEDGEHGLLLRQAKPPVAPKPIALPR